MSEAEGDREAEARALARAFARSLEHLREFRGLRYVGAAELPRAELDDDPAAGVSEADAEAEVRAGTETEPAGEPGPRPSSTVAQQPPAEGTGGARRAPSASPRDADHRASPASQESTYQHSESLVSASSNQHGASSSVAQPGPPRVPPRAARAGGRDAGAERWPAAKKLSILRERHVADCQACRLATTRNSIVFGVGDPEAEIMFVGEAPGADEDRLSEPFVGAAGQRLDRWIEHFGLGRRQVYIANVLKCRPPNNRDPEPDEVEACSKFLRAQIRAIQPKVLIALGRFAGNFLVGADLKLYQMRGKVHRYREPRTGAEVPVVVTYHPAYVLRSEKQPPRVPPEGRPDRDAAIKSEDDKVLADIGRAISLARGRA